MLDNGKLTDDEFFGDIYHPTNLGHKLMSDCLINLFDKIDQEEKSITDIIIPKKPKIGASFLNVKMLHSRSDNKDIKIIKGSFSDVDILMPKLAYEDNQDIFPLNWKHTKESGHQSFIIKLKCKNFLLSYKKNNNPETAGAIDINIDGVKTETIDSYDENGWNNSVTVVLFNESVSKNHEIEIKMAKGSENKEFTIFTLGYTE